MTEEFREEVEFECLQDLGHSDLVTCWTGCREEEEAVLEGEGPLPQDGLASLRRGVLWRVAGAVWGLFSVHRHSVPPHEEQLLDAEFRRHSLRLLLEQDVFLQEDLELMEVLDPGVVSSASARSPPPAPLLGNGPFPRAWDLWTLAALVAVFLCLWSAWGGLGLSALVPWALALGGFLLVRGAGLWREARLRGGMRARGAQLESLARDGRALAVLVRKALRLIQETEVISRGFTLVSAACPFDRVESQLPGLRKAAHRSLCTGLRAYRRATRLMLSAYPLDAQTDDAAHYLCTVPLRDLGLGEEGCPSDELAQELSDDYGLPALKVLFQLFVRQSSEFFRRLALLLSRGPEQGTGWLVHRAVAEVTGPLRPALCGCLGDLQHSYDFHRCWETARGSQGSDGAARARQQQCLQLSALHTSVQRLQLHLRALLNEVIILEDELEKLMVSRETAGASCALELRARLRLLQPHMQASRGCWEEAVAQVGRMLRLAGTPGTPEESAPPLPPPPHCPPSLHQDRDPGPEEQELEAYGSDSDSDSGWRGASSQEERALRRRGREESRPALLELKSVLGLRASEGDRPKRRQLHFRDQAAPRTTLPMEPSEPHGDPNPPEPISREHNHDGPASWSTDVQVCCGRSEGVRAPPVPGSPTAPGGVCAGGGEKDSAPPGGQSLHTGCDRPPEHSTRGHTQSPT